MKKSAILILTLVIVFVLQIPVNAQFGHKPMGKRILDQPNIIEILDLTPEQVKQFNDINYNHQKEVIELHSQIQKNRLEFKNLIVNKNIDDKKILALTDENSKLQAEIKRSAVNKWLAVNKILNDEQKEKWMHHLNELEPKEKMMEHFKERSREHRGLGM